MTEDRALAYGRVMGTLADVGPAKLHGPEIDRVRHAADTLLFASCDDAAAIVALEDVGTLVRGLQDSERWSLQTGQALLADVVACGPSVAVAMPEPAPAAALSAG